MKGTIALIIASCGTCFLIGYLVGESHGREKASEEAESPSECGTKEPDIHPYIDEYMEYEEDPEMPMEEPQMPEEYDVVNDEIPQFHPENIKPHIVTVEYANRNPNEYEYRELQYYIYDEVLYDVFDEDIITEPDELIGYGTTMQIGGGDPDDPIMDIWVENDTMGTIYHIEGIEGAFIDIVDGQAAPDEDDDTE